MREHTQVHETLQSGQVYKSKTKTKMKKKKMMTKRPMPRPKPFDMAWEDF
jgi:hypothetical protein